MCAHENIYTSFFNIKNQVIIITGGVGVLGGSLAEYLAKEEVKVVIIIRSKHTVVDKLKGLKRNK